MGAGKELNDKKCRAAELLLHGEHEATCVPPKRIHTPNYHRSRLLVDETARKSFLSWFDLICKDRQMPWRKDWLSPSDFDGSVTEFRAALAKRAYEVWVSEIMLQQTRVSVVIPYFNNWIGRWPTIQDLAAANQEDVLATWKGLGYYSRATRLLEAAQQIVSDMEGRLPPDVDGLLKIKGIGRYTAGAVSSIAFGRAVPLLDGNVARVLSRQIGLHGRVKDRKVEDLLWETAAALVEQAAGHGNEIGTSDVPGRWNQGLMELGSTICTPKPKCAQCPIQSTCRAHAEGSLLPSATDTTTSLPAMDIEDFCGLCEPIELEEIEEAAEEVVAEQSADAKGNPRGRKRAGTNSTLPSRTAKAVKAGAGKQRSLRDFASFASHSSQEAAPALREMEARTTRLAQAIGYCSTFPKREPKKSVPEEHCIVCIVRRETTPNVQFLIEQRPPRGLLASMWQFPTYTFGKKEGARISDRKAISLEFVRGLIDGHEAEVFVQGEKGMVTHAFSHLKLHMYIHVFKLVCSEEIALTLASKAQPKRLWFDQKDVDDATLGTGMKRCWTQYAHSMAC